MHRDITLLCPACQETRDLRVEVKIPKSQDNTKFNPSASVWADCPACGAKMYQADPELIDALKMLNGAGYASMFHCSTVHLDDNSDMSGFTIEDLFSRELFTEGPHIIIGGMKKGQIESIMNFGKDYTRDYTDDTEIQINIEYDCRKVYRLLGKDKDRGSRIELIAMCKNIDRESLIKACEDLTDFIREWLKNTNSGQLPTGKGGNLRRIANTCWFTACDQTTESPDEDGDN